MVSCSQGGAERVVTSQQCSKTDAKISQWMSTFKLDDWEIDTDRISIFQVSDDYCRVGNQFVGIARDVDLKRATIYHTRQLNEEDIIHELLHIRYPEWSEEAVVEKTAELLDEKRRKGR